jgi:hypothetical protein
MTAVQQSIPASAGVVRLFVICRNDVVKVGCRTRRLNGGSIGTTHGGFTGVRNKLPNSSNALFVVFAR